MADDTLTTTVDAADAGAEVLDQTHEDTTLEPQAEPAAAPKAGKAKTKATKPAKKPAGKPKAPAKADPKAKPAKKGGAAGKPKAEAKPVAAATGDGSYGIDRAGDLPWCEKKVTLFKTLKSMRATAGGDAKSTKAIAEKSGLTARDVRHYGYHAKAGGLVGVATSEDYVGYGFYLTAKGAALDPVKAFKEQEAAKKAK